MSEMEEISGELLEGTHDLPVLPLRNTVLFPQVVVPLAVGRPKSVKLIEEAVDKDEPIAILTQKDPETDDQTTNDIYNAGTDAKMLKDVENVSDE